MVGGEGRGDVKVWKGGQAGDTLRFPSPMPTHQEPLATPIMAVGHAPPGSPSLGAPWSPRPVRSGALGWGAGRERARGPRGRLGARREAGLRGGPGAAPFRPARPPGAPDEEAKAGGAPCARYLLRTRILPVESAGDGGRAPPPRTPILSPPPKTSRPAARVSDRWRWDPGTGRQACSW